MSTIGIIVGSHRQQSQSAKIAEVIKNSLLATAADTSFYELDLGKNPLPLWNEGVWMGDQTWINTWSPITKELAQCDGFVFISPEYGGMASPAIKNFLLLAADGSLSNKPALLVGVSNSRGGSYPISDLRSNGYKNTHVVYIPEHIVVRDAPELFNETPAKPEFEKDQEYLQHRINYAGALLLEYTKALTHVRASGVIDEKNYPYGM